jgi:hypothetical protein
MKMIEDGTYSLSKHNTRAEGIDKRYLSVKEPKEALFKRDLDKPEAHVVPQGPSLSLSGKRPKA